MSFLVCSVSHGSPSPALEANTFYLRRSCEQMEIQPQIFWSQKPFTNTYDLKIVHFLESLESRHEEYVLYVDAWDTIVFSDMETILDRFIKMECDLLFSASKVAHPSRLKHLWQEHEDGNPYRYLCAGAFIGKRSKIIDHLRYLKEKYQETPGRDQPMWVESFCLGEIDLRIDRDCHIFHNEKRGDNALVFDQNGVMNTVTHSRPLIFHTPEGGKVWKYLLPDDKIIGLLYHFLFHERRGRFSTPPERSETFPDI